MQSFKCDHFKQKNSLIYAFHSYIQINFQDIVRMLERKKHKCKNWEFSRAITIEMEFKRMCYFVSLKKRSRSRIGCASSKIKIKKEISQWKDIRARKCVCSNHFFQLIFFCIRLPALSLATNEMFFQAII